LGLPKAIGSKVGQVPSNLLTRDDLAAMVLQ